MITQLRLVLIVGCQRSGTTLLGQILGSHPHAILIDENDESMQVVHSLFGGGVEDSVLSQVLTRARSKYVDGSRISPEGRPSREITHLVVKAPNATHLRERLAALPQRISYLFAVRDVRDVVCSMARLAHIPMVENQTRLFRLEAGLRDRLARELSELESPDVPLHVKRALVWRIKTGFHGEFASEPTSARTVRYEELVTGGADFIQRVVEHAGLATGVSMPQHQAVMQGSGPGLTLRTRAVDRASVGRWVDTLDATAEEEIWSVSARLMAELGYRREAGA